jgi:hypothetical protein
MAIYSKEEAANLGDQVFGTSFLPHSLPKYQFPNKKPAQRGIPACS